MVCTETTHESFSCSGIKMSISQYRKISYDIEKGIPVIIKSVALYCFPQTREKKRCFQQVCLDMQTILSLCHSHSESKSTLTNKDMQFTLNC